MWNPFARRAERLRQDREWFARFAEQLEAFVESLPTGLVVEWERKQRYLSLTIPAATPAHRRLDIEAGPGTVDYALGRVWGEYHSATDDIGNRILAACDAIKAGRVREVRDRNTGLIYHIYRLKTRGFNEYVRDSQYAFRHYLREKVRDVQITRLAPLQAVA